jgi:membrane peptidoglycan carboxypeptidase
MPSRIQESVSHSGDSREQERNNKNRNLTLPYEGFGDIDYSNLLSEDGVIVNKSQKLLKGSSKVNTGHNTKKISDNSKKESTDHYGKKQYNKRVEGVKELKKYFGFSWRKISRQITIFGILIAALVTVGASGVTAWTIDMWNETPGAESLVSSPKESSVMYASDGTTVLYKFYKEEKREVIKIDQVPEVVQLASIALEDENFYYNEDGIPWSNIIGSALDCGRIIITGTEENCRGGSGLSQQLVKLLSGDNQNTIDRKVRELFTSIKLNREKNKQEILELYLNTAPYGRNTYGIQEASKSYFGKDIYSTGENAVTPDEACLLASMVQKPTPFSTSLDNKDNPINPDLQELLRRKNACLDIMYTKDLKGDGTPKTISTQEELNRWQNEDIVAKVLPRNEQMRYPHFVEFAKNELIEKKIIKESDLYTKGLKIVTTIDLFFQDQVQAIVDQNIDQYVIANGANNIGALVLDGPTGEIKAMIGSRDYYNEEIDGKVNITTSSRQPGSSVKPYVYASAFENGFNPGTILMNTPTTFVGGFKPQNLTKTWDGQPVTIRHSLQNSLNIPAVKAVYLSSEPANVPNADSGTENFLNYARQTGLKFPCIPGAVNSLFSDNVEKCDGSEGIPPEEAYKGRCFLASAIGGCEVSMISHATGMNTFAQQGNLRSATPFKHIFYKDGEGNERDLYKIAQESENPPYPRIDQRITPEIARQISNVLSDTRARSFGNLNYILELPGRPVAAKTGTTNQAGTGLALDGWTVGYTPQYTTTVWVGNTDNTPIAKTGINTAGPIWKQIMTKIHEGKEVQNFSLDGLTYTNLDGANGLISGGSGRTEPLTQTQVDNLKRAGVNFSRPEYDARQYSIFENLTTVVTRKKKINTLDNKLIRSEATPASLVAEVECVEVLSEFPQADNWLKPVEAVFGNQRCPLEPSDYVFNENPIIQTPDLAADSQAPTTIIVNAIASFVEGEDNYIKKIVLKINGEPVARENDSDTLSFPTADFTAADALVQIEVEDSLGRSAKKSFDKVDFGKREVSSENVFDELKKASITCQENNQYYLNCSFEFAPELTKTIYMAIGSTDNFVKCQINQTGVACNNLLVGPNNSVYFKYDGNIVISNNKLET